VTARRAALITLVVVIAALSVQAHRRNQHDLTPVHRLAMQITWPIEWVGARIGGAISWAVGGSGDLFDARKRLRRAEAELIDAREAVVRAAVLENENRQLRAFLELQPMLPTRTQAARILTRSSGAHSRTFRIDRGARSGVLVGQSVLGKVGIVGSVVEVEAFTALVLEVTDVRSQVPVRIGSEARAAFLVGDGDRALVLEGVPEQYRDEISRGMPLWTSGEDGLAPAGLAVGRIGEISDTTRGLFLEIEAEPFEDPASLTLVQVLMTDTRE